MGSHHFERFKVVANVSIRVVPPPFFIELRLGYLDPKVRPIVQDVKGHFRFGRKECHRVPHISLFGPFHFKRGYDLDDLQRIIEGVTGNLYELPFTIDGWDGHQGSKGQVVAFRVVPSEELRTFHRNLARALCKIAHSDSPWDCSDRPAWFHITLAMHLTERKYDSVMRYVSGRDGAGMRKASFMDQLLSLIRRRPTYRRRAVRPLYFPASCLRITVLQQQRIRTEYDLIRKRWLSREEARSGWEYARTLSAYRRYHGLELTSPRHAHGPTEYVIGDLHLGHRNIIRYCARPFSTKDVDEMDEVLIRNWNHCVKPTDRVYFLGDLALGDTPAMGYRRRLNGSIIHIQGNHDSGIPDTYKFLTVSSSGINFRFVHDPKDTGQPSDGDVWTIHGHTHNNDLRRYPFFDPDHRKINVSAEVVGYQPVSVPFLVNLITTRSERIETIWDC